MRLFLKLKTTQVKRLTMATNYLHLHLAFKTIYKTCSLIPTQTENKTTLKLILSKMCTLVQSLIWLQGRVIQIWLDKNTYIFVSIISIVLTSATIEFLHQHPPVLTVWCVPLHCLSLAVLSVDLCGWPIQTVGGCIIWRISGTLLVIIRKCILRRTHVPDQSKQQTDMASKNRQEGK